VSDERLVWLDLAGMVLGAGSLPVRELASDKILQPSFLALRDFVWVETGLQQCWKPCLYGIGCPWQGSQNLA
jgi:hypothetical protein